MLPEGYTLPPPTQYTYSYPVVIRTWSGGSLAIKVGYVREHPEKNSVVLEQITTVKGQPKQKLFYIRDAKDWGDICNAVNKLWPELASTTNGDQIEEAVKNAVAGQKLLDLISNYPNL